MALQAFEKDTSSAITYCRLQSKAQFPQAQEFLERSTFDLICWVIDSAEELEQFSDAHRIRSGVIFSREVSSTILRSAMERNFVDVIDFETIRDGALAKQLESAEIRHLLRTPFGSESRVLESLARGVPLQTVLTEIVRELETRQPDMLCSILLVDPQQKCLLHGAAPSLPSEYNKLVHGYPIGPDRGSCGTAAWLGKRVIVSDIQKSPLWERFRDVASRFDFRACWSQPIFSSSGRVLGTFASYYRAPREPLQNELRLIEMAAAVAGIAISQRETEGALRYRFDFERLVMSVSNRFISSSVETLDRELDASLQEIGEFTKADRCSIFLFSSDHESMSTSHEWCREGVRSEKSRLQSVPLQAFPWLQEKLIRHQAVVLKQLSELPREASREYEEFRLRAVDSFVGVPIVHSGRVYGLLTLESIGHERTWTSDIIVLLRICTQLFAHAIERRKTKEELQVTREQSSRKDLQLRVTFETAQIGMATCTLSGRFLSVNSALCRMVGRSAEELLQLSFREISQPDEKTTRRKMRELLRGKVAQIELEKCFLHSSGRFVHVVLRMGAIFYTNEKPLYLVAEIEDITEKKKWEAEYLKASKLESLGVLAGGIAHDFNNILMAILGTVSKTKLELPQQSKPFQQLKDVEQAVYRARDLTHQLLTFSKGGAPIKRTASMAEIIRQTIGFSLSGSDVSPVFEAPENLWPVQVDAGQISQVLHNLILNAIQAMPEGGTLRVSCHNLDFRRRAQEYGLPLESGKYVVITFRDEGHGIPPENLSKIFDPFFSTKESGSGLGLATTYSIVKRHQGHIEVDSTPGKGTCFSVYLPASPKAVLDIPKEEASVQKGHGRILLMDDEDMVRRAAEGMLRTLGYEVQAVVNGLEAVEQYQRARESGNPFDAVIMDLTIPGGMGGKVAIRKLRRLDPNVKAIVSSGYADGPVMAEFRKFGFRGMMAKPYELTTLSSVLVEVLSDNKSITSSV